MKNRTNLFAKTVITLIIFFIILTLTTCDLLFGMLKNNVKEPEVSFNYAKINHIDFNGIELLCNVSVENPNSFVIPFPDTNWKLYLNGENFISFDISKDENYNSLTIKAGESVPIEFTVSFDFLNIINLFTSFIGQDIINYKIELEILIPVSQLDTTIPIKIEKEGEFPMLKAPTLKTPSVSGKVIYSNNILGLSVPTGIELSAGIDFINPNGFDLPSPSLNIEYKVNNTSVVNGGITSKPLEKSSTTTIEYKDSVSVPDFIPLISSLISGNLESNFIISYDFNIPSFPGAKISNEIVNIIN